MWQPTPDYLQNVTNLITEAFSSPSNVRQKEIAQQIEKLQQDSQFPCYLLCVLRNSNLPLNIRLASGYTLKSSLEKNLELPWNCLEFLQKGILGALEDTSLTSATSSIAAAFYLKVDGWPQLLELLAQKTEQEYSMSTFLKVLEDISVYPAMIDLLETSEYQEPLKVLVPKLLVCAESGAVYAIKCFNLLVNIMPSVLIPVVPRYLEALLRLKNLEYTEIREQVAEGLFALSSTRKDLVSSRFSECAEFMLQMLHTKPGCNFFSEWLERKNLVFPYLVPLLSYLLNNLKVTQEDLMEIMPEQEQARFEKESEVSRWTQRRESSVLLDSLARHFGDQCFHILQQQIETLVMDSDWVNVESGLLAVGALAQGAHNAIVPYLPKLFNFFLQQMQNPQRLVKSMALWTASRFTDDIIQTEMFKPYLQSVMRCVMEPDHLVQVAACTAFCVLVCRNPLELFEYLDEVLKIFSQAFEHYTGKALLNLLDAIASIADVLGEDLNQENYVSSILPPLIKLWNKTQDNDKLIWTLSETLTSLTLALGSVMDRYANPLISRCCRLINLSVNGAEKQFAMKGLELAGAVIESVSCLPDLSELCSLVNQSLQDKDVGVRQYAAATSGDLFIKAQSCVLALIDDFATKLLNCIVLIQASEDISDLYLLATNNAVCSFAELTVQFTQTASPRIPEFLERVIPIAKQHLKIPQVKLNIMQSLGKVGLSNPHALAGALDEVFDHWCVSIKNMPHSDDKGNSFRGMCRALAVNPSVLDTKFQYFADAIVAYPEPDEDVNQMAGTIIHRVRDLAGDAWERYIAQLSFREAMRSRFGV